MTFAVDVTLPRTQPRTLLVVVLLYPSLYAVAEHGKGNV